MNSQQHGAGGGGMGAGSLQDLQRLQQQLQAQYNRQQPPNTQLGTNMPGMPAQQQHNSMQQQQHNMQQQQHNQHQQQQAFSSNPQYAAMQAQQQQQQQLNRSGQMSNTQLAMMQQQQQQGQAVGMQHGGGANYGSWNNNGMQGNNNNNNNNGGCGGSGNNAAGTASTSSMDASTASSARLAAMAGMGMSIGGAASGKPGNNNMMGNTRDSSLQNMQALLQQQQQNGTFPQQQQQQQQQHGGGAQGMMGHSDQNSQSGGTQQLLLQQQLANLQKQIHGGQQQQQQQHRGGGGGGGSSASLNAAAVLQNQAAAAAAGMQGGNHHSNNSVVGGGMDQNASSNNMMHSQQQQQLLQQMQQQQQQQRGGQGGGMMQQMASNLQQHDSGRNSMSGMMGQQRMGQRGSLTGGMGSGGNNNDSFMMQSLMGGGQVTGNQQQQLQNVGVRGSLNEQQLLLHQQNLIKQQAGQQNESSSQSNPGSNNNNTMQMNSQSAAAFQGMQSGSGGGGMSQMQDNGMSANAAAAAAMNESSMRSLHSSMPTPMQSSNSQQNGDNPDQKSFLDGRFAGGWQSNNDLPNRRRVIFSILEVIQQMRPETNKLSEKLPHMAKSLEEHLYRSAQSMEEYLDLTTLKRRLQTIAHGLELHRSNSSVSMKRTDSPSGAQGSSSQHANFANNGQSQSAQQTSQQQNASWGNVGGSGNTNVSSSNMANLAAHLNRSESSNMGDHQGNASHQRSLAHHGALSGESDMNLSHHGSSSGAQRSSANTGNQGILSDGNQGSSQMSQQQNERLEMQQGQMGMQQLLAGQQQQQMGAQLMAGQQMSAQQQMANQQQMGLPQMDTWANIGTASMPPPAFGGSSVPPNLYPDGESPSQKKKVILQQQQRLLLLRHASKCKVGQACTTKFCTQMVTLWNHMKGCRNKNCETSHCRSSRCVLNHYRICKSQGKTATCEVCGPVMAKIKRQERDGGEADPLAVKDQEIIAQGLSVASAASGSNLSDKFELQQLQAQQLKLQGQLDSLKQLEKQQEQLIEQQRRLHVQAQQIKDPNSQQAQQVQQQQLLLQELQSRCQEQQMLLQQVLQMPPTSGGQSLSSQRSLSPMQQRPTPAAVSEAPSGPPAEPPKKRKSAASEGKGRRGSKGKGKRSTGNKGKVLAAASGVAKTEDSTGRKRSSGQSGTKERQQKKTKAAPKEHETNPADKLPFSGKDGSAVVQPDSPQDMSLISVMTRDAIEKHLESLNKGIRLSSRTVTHKCLPIIQAMIEDQFGWVFHDAVDPVALGLPDYFEVVKHPMHLELVKKKLDNAIYSDMSTFARDGKLVFENAILYNGENSEVGALAQTMLEKFEKLYTTLLQGIETSQQNLESQGVACSLCGTQKRQFEPTVLYCQGQCGMQSIKRKATYYTDRTKQNHWCEACHVGLDANAPIVLEDGSEIKKNELQEFKNDALPEEAWVHCDQCHSWVHQVCALFNGRTNKSTSTYSCPNCHLKRTNESDNRTPTEKLMKGAEDLTHCKMSVAIESGLNDALLTAYKEKAAELGVGLDEVEKASGVTVRVVSNMEKKQYVGEEMLQRYPESGHDSEFPVRSKCIALFQKIHGVDALLFALYVYEYGHNCPASNRRRVYISYLDSVQYFEPKCYRTIAYQAILVEYLRYVKERGFHTAHIWSCPPTPGDDYIFYSHPSHQLIPHEDMLRAWYHQMLDKAKAQGIVIRTTTLYDEYFTSDGGSSAQVVRRDPSCIPYFEGDYIPGELENIIKRLKQRGPVSEDSNSKFQDEVMRGLGHNLSKMKDNFIVVHLRNRRFAAAVELGEDVSGWLEDSDEELVRSKRAKISGKGPSSLPPSSKLDIQSSGAITEVAKLSDRKESLPATTSDDKLLAAATTDAAKSSPSEATVSAVPVEAEQEGTQSSLVTTGEGDKKRTIDSAQVSLPQGLSAKSLVRDRTSTTNLSAPDTVQVADEPEGMSEKPKAASDDVPTKEVVDDGANKPESPPVATATAEKLGPDEATAGDSTTKSEVSSVASDGKPAPAPVAPRDEPSQSEAECDGPNKSLSSAVDEANDPKAATSMVAPAPVLQVAESRPEPKSEEGPDTAIGSSTLPSTDEPVAASAPVAPRDEPSQSEAECDRPNKSLSSAVDEANVPKAATSTVAPAPVLQVTESRPEPKSEEGPDTAIGSSTLPSTDEPVAASAPVAPRDEPSQSEAECDRPNKSLSSAVDEANVPKAATSTVAPAPVLQVTESRPEPKSEEGLDTAIGSSTLPSTDEPVAVLPQESTEPATSEPQTAPVAAEPEPTLASNDDAKPSSDEPSKPSLPDSLEAMKVTQDKVATDPGPVNGSDKQEAAVVTAPSEIEKDAPDGAAAEVKADVAASLLFDAEAKSQPTETSEPPVKVEAKPVADTEETSGPAATAKADAESQPKETSGPVAKGEAKAETESPTANAPKPPATVESEAISQPTGTAEPAEKVEAVTETNAQPMGTSEPGVKVEANTDAIVEPTDTSAPAEKVLTGAETELPPKGTSEPADEVKAEAEAKTDSQPMDTSEPAGKAEAAPESQPTSTSKPAEKAKTEPQDIVPLGGSKRGIDEIEPALARHAAGLTRRGPKNAVADTVDEDEPNESELFESRQQFLNYCQTNHCQFDELRRAKHSSMMVLFQLHNPTAPMFLQQCGACYRDITHGVRYQCNDCSNFGLCQDCYEPVTTGLWAQRDPRFAHDKSHTFTPFDMEASDETHKTREERQRSLKTHLELLEHVANCSGPPGCSLHNCQRMKKLFEHVQSCEIKPRKECKVCTRLFSLCSVHARSCGAKGDTTCPIPFCDRIRERNKRLRKQQQLMDDRRRRAQNELYHAGGNDQS